MITNSQAWAIYLRVSDEDKQSPERSFAMQRQRIKEQLTEPSMLPVESVYQDMLTGTSPNRTDYQQMLKDAAIGRFSHLGLYRADRFGRNAAEGLQAAAKLISSGIKIRVANMPGLTPETPDGFFMFLLQMGLAQREVDVLRLRTTDGMEAKARLGGWPHKAPGGYINKEKLIKSGKYERWVEKDPKHWQGFRDAWELLLTDRYTLDQICEELDKRGHTRSTGSPWAWNHPKTDRRMRAKNRLHEIFHNPFYAGWLVSEKFGIKMGEIRGNWEPIVTPEEYKKGLAILHQHDDQKSRLKRHIYLLRDLLWVQTNNRRLKMYGSTPSGRSQSYAYYITQAMVDGKKMRFRCEHIDSQIADWLQNIIVNPDFVPEIRATYREQIKKTTRAGSESEISALKRRTTQLQNEEARLGRLFMTGKIGEDAYEQLRTEWQGKRSSVDEQLANLKRDEHNYLDDLEVALALMPHLGRIYERIEPQQRAILLRLFTKRIIVDASGKIVDYDLRSPFTYLAQLAQKCSLGQTKYHGSEQVRFGVLYKR